MQTRDVTFQQALDTVEMLSPGEQMVGLDPSLAETFERALAGG